MADNQLLSSHQASYAHAQNERHECPTVAFCHLLLQWLAASILDLYYSHVEPQPTPCHHKTSCNDLYDHS